MHYLSRRNIFALFLPFTLLFILLICAPIQCFAIPLDGHDQALFEKANRQIQSDPNNFAAYYLRGACYLRSKAFQSAVADFSSALRLNPSLAQAYTGRAVAYAQLGLESKALNDVNASVHVNPADWLAHNMRAAVLVKEHKFQEALSDANQSIELNSKRAESYDQRAQIYYQLKQYDKSLLDAEMALKLNPSSAHAMRSIGNVYFTRNNFEPAAAAYSNAIKIEPAHALTYVSRARAYAAAGKYDLALKDCGISLEKDNKWAPAYLTKGDIYQAQGKTDDALMEYDSCLKLSDNCAPAYFGRSGSNWTKQNYSKAIDDLKKAIAIDGTNVIYLQTLRNRDLFLLEAAPYVGIKGVAFTIKIDKNVNCLGLKGKVARQLDARLKSSGFSTSDSQHQAEIAKLTLRFARDKEGFKLETMMTTGAGEDRQSFPGMAIATSLDHLLACLDDCNTLMINNLTRARQQVGIADGATLKDEIQSLDKKLASLQTHLR